MQKKKDKHIYKLTLTIVKSMYFKTNCLNCYPVKLILKQVCLASTLLFILFICLSASKFFSQGEQQYLSYPHYILAFKKF